MIYLLSGFNGIRGSPVPHTIVIDDLCATVTDDAGRTTTSDRAHTAAADADDTARSHGTISSRLSAYVCQLYLLQRRQLVLHCY